MQPVETWIAGVLYLFILLLEWEFILLGFWGCCGWKLKSILPANRSVNNGSTFSIDAASDDDVCLKPQTLPKLLFISMTLAMMSTGTTLFQKFFTVDDNNDPAVCATICKLDILLYGASKLVIFLALYIKAYKMCDCYPDPDSTRRNLCIIVSVCSISYFGSILMNVINPDNVDYINGGICYCTTRAIDSTVFLVCDWLLSLSLFAYFIRPVIMRIRTRRRHWSGDHEQQFLPLLHSATVEYFIAAILSLVVAPILVGYYVWTNYQGLSSAEEDPFRRDVLLLKLDLVICCSAQLFVCRKLWTWKPCCSTSAAADDDLREQQRSSLRPSSKDRLLTNQRYSLQRPGRILQRPSDPADSVSTSAATAQ